MFIIGKKRKGVSPVVATILIIGLTLAAASIVFLVVMPMLNPAATPNLIVQQVVEIKDYDNDGYGDLIAVQIQNVQGGAEANITNVQIVATTDVDARQTSWKPLTGETVLLNEGDQKILKFIV